MRPFTDSRSERVCVERGNMAYSAVTQPRPLPARHRGTPCVTVAAHSTRVRPNSMSTDPSAWSSQLRVIVMGRSSSGCRPSGRDINGILSTDRSDVVGVAGLDKREIAMEDLLRLRESTAGVPPRYEVGEQQLINIAPDRVISRFPAGQVNVRRVVIALEVRRFAQEQVSLARQLDQLVTHTAVRAVGKRLSAGADAHAVSLDRMVDRDELDIERADADVAWP